MRNVGLALAITAVLMFSTACSDEREYSASDCDRADLAEHDSDCGYWQGDQFILWYWVGTTGGYRPAGWDPARPNIRPATAPKPKPKPAAPAAPRGRR